MTDDDLRAIFDSCALTDPPPEGCDECARIQAEGNAGLMLLAAITIADGVERTDVLTALATAMVTASLAHVHAVLP